jgi:tRNA-modifying protein YgfZ
MFELPKFHVIQVLGQDAEKVVNNLCTNDIKRLAVDACCEAFVTNVRGWCVEHGFVLKAEGQIQLVGQFGNPAALCAHIDRYIVREDAKVADASNLKCVFLLAEAEAEQLNRHFATTSLAPINGRVQTAEIASRCVTAVSVSLLNSSDVLLVADKHDAQEIAGDVAAAGLVLGSADEFERQRITSLWPLSGREILEKTIPQELDRDRTAISFTKGCYLGQETIARLDAIGQLQKKLCLVQIDTKVVVESGSALMNADQNVGLITSAAIDASGSFVQALAYMRRGNFEPGLHLTCKGADAVVLQPH